MSLMWLSSFASSDKIDDVNDEQYREYEEVGKIISSSWIR